MFNFLSVVRIITTLKKPAGHFVTSVTPQLVGSWGLAGKHDILSYGYAGWLPSIGGSGLKVVVCELRHSRVGQLGTVVRYVCWS